MVCPPFYMSTTSPPALTPWSWKLCFAKSIPNTVIGLFGALFFMVCLTFVLMFSIKLHYGPFEAVEEVRRTIPLDSIEYDFLCFQPTTSLTTGKMIKIERLF